VLALSVGLIGCAAEVPKITEYNLTISSTEGGSVTSPGEPGPYTYDEGKIVNLVTKANEGYQFVNWTGDVDTISNVDSASTTITMNGDYEITANFKETPPPLQYNLTISSSTGGWVTIPGEGTRIYDEGTVVSLVATADVGYQFLDWTGDADTIGDVDASSTTITINANHSITARFVAEIPPDAVEIRNWYDLDAVRDNLEGSYVLMNDLDATTAGYAELASSSANGGEGWQPIGRNGYWDWEQSQWLGDIFRGDFYGQGYVIRSLFIGRPDEFAVALFGWIGGGGILENVCVVDADMTGGSYVGGLVGISVGGTISNSYSTSSVAGENAGGLVAWEHGVVVNSHYNYDEFLINGESIITTGALVGKDFEQWLDNDKFLNINERLSQEDDYYLINDVSDFKQLLAFGQDASLKFRLKNDLDLGTEANFYIPYLAGEFDGNCHKISNLSFSFDSVSCVGLFGYLASGGKVTQVGVENVRVTGYGDVGGLVGLNAFAIVSNSYATGNVTGGLRVGGLVGGNWGTVSNSYSDVDLAFGQLGVELGGLAGLNAVKCSISNCYASGSVPGEPNVGGLVGENWGGPVSNSFWDMQTSGRTTSAGGTGKTTAEMKDIATFSTASWNITAVAPGERNTAFIWNIVDGQTYPFLSWQP
jgi:hypothetical protein